MFECDVCETSLFITLPRSHLVIQVDKESEVTNQRTDSQARSQNFSNRP
jgi:hypothetical protein